MKNNLDKRSPEPIILLGNDLQYSVDNYMLDMDIVYAWKYSRSTG